MRRQRQKGERAHQVTRLVALVAAFLTAAAPLAGVVLAVGNPPDPTAVGHGGEGDRPTRALSPLKATVEGSADDDQASAAGATGVTSAPSQQTAPPATPETDQASTRSSTGAAQPARWYTDRELELLARLVHAEAEGEPYAGRVGVAAVVLNRVRHPRFPGSIAGVIFQPGAFEPVANGRIWEEPDRLALQAARDALNGWDPTGGALYFYNPAKVGRSSWIWQVHVTGQIGRHAFGWR